MLSIGLLLGWLFGGSAFALDRVALQLKWHHQFQFAGYYAAKALGYYREAGLEVEIRPADLARNPAEEVISGRAEFGIANTDLLLMRQRGQPVVALATIFQHSPNVLIAMRRNGIESVHDLVGKKVLIDPFATEILAYLKAMGVPLDQLDMVQVNDYSYQDLLNGRADASTGYLTNEPFYLEQAGADFLSFTPRSAGIDFYGDTLFTTEQQIRQFPARVAAFREASLRGWRYAVANPEQVIELMIEQGWARTEDRSKLRFEAEKLSQIIRSDLVEIGYMHEGRWRHVVNTYADLGILPHEMSLEGFLYGSRTALLPQWAWWLFGVFLCAAVLAGGFAAYAHRARLRLEAQIAQRERAEHAELKLAAEVYQALGDALLLTDQHNLIVSANPAFTQMSGYAPDALIGRHPGMLLTEKDSTEMLRTIQRGLTETGQWSGQLEIVGKDGRPLMRHMFMKVIKDDAGQPLRHICIFSSIDNDKSKDDTIWNSIHLDALTGLPNRKLFLQTLVARIEHPPKGQPQVLALLMLDIDRFKEVNDVLGQYVGDQVLIETAHRLRQCIGLRASLARFESDTFAILLTDPDTLLQIESVAQCILKAMAEPFHSATLPIHLSASIGIAQYPRDCQSAERLIQLGEQAMVVAKETGRNRRVHFSASMQEAAFERARLTNDLRQALDAGELYLEYQPIVSLHNGAIAKAEALLRWRHPSEGLISPAKFIPLAERSGLIHSIGRWAFREACRQLQQWRQQYPLQLSINKSPLEFEDDNDLLEELALIREIGLAGSAVAIEITEGLLLQHTGTVSEKLASLRDAGIQLSLDDFGTGYSSMAYLQKIEIGFIKIDRTFVRHLETSPSDRTLCHSIIMMAHGLGIQVIAEGVETAEQARILSDLGCDFGQGYHFSRPLPAEQFEALIGKSNQASAMSY